MYENIRILQQINLYTHFNLLNQSFLDAFDTIIPLFGLLLYLCLSVTGIFLLYRLKLKCLWLFILFRLHRTVIRLNLWHDLLQLRLVVHQYTQLLNSPNQLNRLRNINLLLFLNVTLYFILINLFTHGQITCFWSAYIGFSQHKTICYSTSSYGYAIKYDGYFSYKRFEILLRLDL